MSLKLVATNPKREDEVTRIVDGSMLMLSDIQNRNFQFITRRDTAGFADRGSAMHVVAMNADARELVDHGRLLLMNPEACSKDVFARGMHLAFREAQDKLGFNHTSRPVTEKDLKAIQAEGRSDPEAARFIEAVRHDIRQGGKSYYVDELIG